MAPVCRVTVADRRAVVASVATQSEIVAPAVDALPAKTVYDAVLYSFAEDSSATAPAPISTR